MCLCVCVCVCVCVRISVWVGCMGKEMKCHDGSEASVYMTSLSCQLHGLTHCSSKCIRWEGGQELYRQEL